MKSLFPIFFYHRAGRAEKALLMLLVLFLNGLFWGCSSGSEQGSAGQEVREFTLESALNSGKEEKKEIGEHLKIKQSVILEFNEDHPIQNIHKIMVQEPHIFILDNAQNYLYLYDDQGKFVRRIGTLGSGPGEYRDITDFTLTDDEIVIFSNDSRKIIHYEKDGALIREIPIPFSGASVVPVDSGYILWTRHNVSSDAPYDLILMDSTGQMIRGAEKADPGFPSFTSSGFLVKQGPENVRYLKMFGQEIHDLDENFDPRPLYRFDLGPTALRLKENMNIENLLSTHHEKTFLSDMYWESSSLILLYFHHDLRRSFGLIPKSDWQMHTESWYEDHAILDILRSIKTGYMTEENLYVCSNPGFYQSEDRFALIDSFTSWDDSVTGPEDKKKLIENSNGLIFEMEVVQP